MYTKQSKRNIVKTQKKYKKKYKKKSKRYLGGCKKIKKRIYNQKGSADANFGNFYPEKLENIDFKKCSKYPTQITDNVWQLCYYSDDPLQLFLRRYKARVRASKDTAKASAAATPIFAAELKLPGRGNYTMWLSDAFSNITINPTGNFYPEQLGYFKIRYISMEKSPFQSAAAESRPSKYYFIKQEDIIKFKIEIIMLVKATSDNSMEDDNAVLSLKKDFGSSLKPLSFKTNDVICVLLTRGSWRFGLYLDKSNSLTRLGWFLKKDVKSIGAFTLDGYYSVMKSNIVHNAAAATPGLREAMAAWNAEIDKLFDKGKIQEFYNVDNLYYTEQRIADIKAWIKQATRPA
jgi:hypothetical protein